MKVFLTHSFRTELDQKYYDLIKSVMKILYENNHEIYLGGLLATVSDTLKKYGDKITCYSVEAYKDEQKNCPNAKYILVEDGFIRTKALCENTDCVVMTPGGTGSLAEFYSILEEYRYQKMNKKIYILNFEHYYDELISSLKKLVEDSFNGEDTFDYIEEINIEQLELIMKEGYYE